MLPGFPGLLRRFVPLPRTHVRPLPEQGIGDAPRAFHLSPMIAGMPPRGQSLWAVAGLETGVANAGSANATWVGYVASAPACADTCLRSSGTLRNIRTIISTGSPTTFEKLPSIRSIKRSPTS